MITAQRYHDISCGHRVHGHESKCAHLHGHNYRVHFTVRPVAGAGLDAVGRVLDFSVIKTRLCLWLEDHWDHRFLAWEQDPWYADLKLLDPAGVVGVPFNPTAERMAQWLLQVVGPQQLAGTGCELVSVTVEETSKCAATAARDRYEPAKSER